jgi:hypothetical protein
MPLYLTTRLGGFFNGYTGRIMIKTTLAFLLLLLCYRVGLAEPAYIVPLQADWQVRPILTVGESALNSYAMVGAPDGLGAFTNPDGSLSVLMNHEIGRDKGRVRAHGQKGAFVSHWVIDVESLQVVKGEDLVQSKIALDAALPFHKLCSADLAPTGAFFDSDSDSGKGFSGQFFLNGEEDKGGGRAFAHGLDGISYELKDFGQLAWENVLIHPHASPSTLVMALDDIQQGLLVVYLGQKRAEGNPVEQAGLVGGQLFAVQVQGERFNLVPLPDAAQAKGAALREAAIKLGATGFARPEDGAWDTHNPRAFWFNTTDKVGGDSRLQRLEFDDIHRPLAGGHIQTILQAKQIGAEMLDNLAVDTGGRVLLQEDPGDHPRLAAIWAYEPSSGVTKKLFEANPALFSAGQSGFMTTDEEHSGIVEVTALLQKASWFDARRRYYLGTTQAHVAHAKTDLVEHGQLWLISGPRE